MSLLSLVLSVRPLEKVSLPSALGRAAHAALLKRIAARDAALADSLHVEGGTRPFTVSSLLGKRANGFVLPEVNYTLRFTALSAEVAKVSVQDMDAAAKPMVRRPKSHPGTLSLMIRR